MKLPLSISPLLLLAIALLSSTACNLSIDLDAHPYRDVGGIDDVSDEETLPPVGPKLLITELMILPAPVPGDDQRWGQYIELYNAGDQPIHPDELIIEILETNERIALATENPEAQQAVDDVEPIEPGAFFVFLRRDDPYYGIVDHLQDGSYYEFGPWDPTIALAPTRQTLRLLELRGEFEFRIHHQVGWRQGALVDLDGDDPTESLDITENVGLGLKDGIFTVDEASELSNWCFHIERFGDGPLYGSPGSPSPDRCM